jgi:hypothetical protein
MPEPSCVYTGQTISLTTCSETVYPLGRSRYVYASPRSMGHVHVADIDRRPRLISTHGVETPILLDLQRGFKKKSLYLILSKLVPKYLLGNAKGS